MSLWEFAVKRWQFTLVVFALLIATGVTTLSLIPRSEDPSLTFPGSFLVITYPGADPDDMEQLVVDPIEDALNELDEVKKIERSAMDGLATVRIEFTWGVDADRKYDEVVREINRLRPSLPADILDIDVREFKPSLVNIVQLALVSEQADWRRLQGLAEDLEEAVESAPGVRRADSWAYPRPEVRVAVDLERLSAAGVTLGQVMAAIKAVPLPPFRSMANETTRSSRSTN